MIGDRIRQLRLEKGTTQKDLSDFLGVTPKMVSFYENNKRFPSQSYISKIAKYFDVTTDYILGVSDVKAISEVDELRRLKTQLTNEIEMLSAKQCDLSERIKALGIHIAESKARLISYENELTCVKADFATANESINHSKEKLKETEEKLSSIVESDLPNKTDLLKKIIPTIFEGLYETLDKDSKEGTKDNKRNVALLNFVKFLEKTDIELQAKAFSGVIKDIEFDENKKQMIITVKRDGD